MNERSIATLEANGYERRFYLIGHPAYPDPAMIWPATEGNAARWHADYVAPTFEEYVTKLGHTPHTLFGGPLTAETFKPRIGVRWDLQGSMPTWEPSK